MNTHPQKYVIFDFDGTLADSLPAFISIFNYLAPKHNYAPVNMDEIDALRGKSAREVVRGLWIAKLKIPIVFRDGMIEFRKRIHKIPLFPDMKEIIHTLSQAYHLGIVTSNSKENVESFLKANEIGVFEFIFTDRSIFGKGAVIRNVIKKYQLERAAVVYVGDEVRDIDAARQVGIPIISVSWGFNTREILEKNNPDFIVNTPQELLSILNTP